MSTKQCIEVDYEFLNLFPNTDVYFSSDNVTALIFATRNQISGISLDPNMTIASILAVPQLNQAVAVDVEVSRGFFYWSDVTDGTISRVAVNGSLRQTIIRGKDVSRCVLERG